MAENPYFCIFVNKYAIAMECFRPGDYMKKRQEKKVKPTEPPLAKVPGVVVRDCEVLWSKDICGTSLTPRQIEIVRREMKWKGWNAVKVEHVHSRMAHRTCAQIVKELRHVDGMGERTVKGLHAALSKAGVGGK